MEQKKRKKKIDWPATYRAAIRGDYRLRGLTYWAAIGEMRMARMVGLRGWMRENWRKSWWRERERGIEGLVFDVVGEVGDYAYVFDKGSVLVAVFDGELAL